MARGRVRQPGLWDTDDDEAEHARRQRQLERRARQVQRARAAQVDRPAEQVVSVTRDLDPDEWDEVAAEVQVDMARSAWREQLRRR